MQLPDGSAHTIRFSEKTNFFFTSGFEKSVNVWKIDVTKDFTRVINFFFSAKIYLIKFFKQKKIGKVSAGLKASVTTMEIFD